jgi:hypothetical protein
MLGSDELGKVLRVGSGDNDLGHVCFGRQNLRRDDDINVESLRIRGGLSFPATFCPQLRCQTKRDIGQWKVAPRE